MIVLLLTVLLILLIIAPVYLYSTVLQTGTGIPRAECPAEWKQFRPSWREAIRGDRPASMAAVVILVVLLLMTGPPVMLLYRSNAPELAAELLYFSSLAASIGGPLVLAALAVISQRTSRARRLFSSGKPVECFHMRNTVVSMPRRGSTEHGVYFYFIGNRAYRLFSQPLEEEPSFSPLTRTAFEEAYGLNGRKLLGRDLPHQERAQALGELKNMPTLTAAVDPDDPGSAVIVQGFLPTTREVPALVGKVVAGYAVLLVVLAGILISSARNTLDGSLGHALREQHLGIARVLVSLGADVKAGWLLDDAVGRNDLGSLRFLVSQGADLHARDAGGSLVETAARQRSADLMRYLLEQGSDPLHRTADGKTLLMLAVQNSASTDVMRLLVERGVEVNARDGQGNTALHYLPLTSTWLYDELVTLGADMGARNKDGKTAADLREQRASRSYRSFPRSNER